MHTCDSCHRPIEKGYFIDRSTGVTMHAACFARGIRFGPRPARAARPSPVAATAAPRRLAA